MASHGRELWGGVRGAIGGALLAAFAGAIFGQAAWWGDSSWSAWTSVAWLGGWFFGGSLLQGAISIEIGFRRGPRRSDSGTQTPRDPRVTKKPRACVDPPYGYESSVTPRSSDESEVDRRQLGFPFWHRRSCVDRDEYEEVCERAVHEGAEAWHEHRFEVGGLATARAPWSRPRTRECDIVPDDDFQICWAAIVARREDQQEALLHAAMECYPGHYVGDESD